MSQKASEKWLQRLRGAAVILVICMIAEMAVAASIIDPLILARPSDAAARLLNLLAEADFLRDSVQTVLRLVTSLLIGGTIGISFGLAFGSRPALYALIEAPLHALRSIPTSALYPVVILVFGIGTGSLVAMATVPTALVLMVATVDGVRAAHRGRRDLAKLLGLTRFEHYWHILLREALPHIVTGLKTAGSYALVIIVALELFVGSYAGLGQRLYRYQTVYDIPAVYATLIVAGVLGYVLNYGLFLAERRFAHWVGH